MLSKQLLFRLLAATFASHAFAAKHHLFVGNLVAPTSLHSLEFDDETLDFTLTKTMKADAAHSWITFSHDKANVYGTSNLTPRVASYAVIDSSTLQLTKSIPSADLCNNKTSAFALASSVAPYRVITGAWPGPNACGMSFDVDSNGTLEEIADTWSYTDKSGVHGLTFGGGDSELVYSADLNGDALWTHRVSHSTGKATVVGKFSTNTGAHPRHMASHPAGKYVYAVMEADNRVASFLLDEETKAVKSEEATYSLIPEGHNKTNYWSAEVMTSPGGEYLWVTARANSNTTRTGYISVFLLAPTGSIAKRMFIVPTTTVGGIANAITPAPWGSEWAAMTDIPSRYVQIWKMTGKTEGEYGTEYTSAEAVARVDIKDGGCCANAIWYD